MNPPPSDGDGGVTRRLIRAADYFLRQRNFKECHAYATRARNNDSNHPDPYRILSIASVLSAPNIASNLPDYYAILGVPRFERNANWIWTNFQTLESNLNPNENLHSFSAEAHGLVTKAWAVLSNPTEKAAFDAELGGCASGSRSSTFWTMCPYCYYLYEFNRGFEDCSLRCTNVNCLRSLHAVELSGPPPPPEIADSGSYFCPGFVQCVPVDSNGEKIGNSLWSPFDFPKPCNSAIFGGNFVAEGRGEDGTEYLKDNGLGETKKRKTGVNSQSKKLMERGLKVDMNKASSMINSGVEDKGSYSDPRFGDETRNNNAGEVEFFEGDGDVLVGLQNIF